MITKADRAVLWTLWANEDPDDNGWRDHLNEEQAAMVRLWDLAFEVRARKEAAGCSR